MDATQRRATELTREENRKWLRNLEFDKRNPFVVLTRESYMILVSPYLAPIKIQIANYFHLYLRHDLRAFDLVTLTRGSRGYRKNQKKTIQRIKRLYVIASLKKLRRRYYSYLLYGLIHIKINRYVSIYKKGQ